MAKDLLLTILAQLNFEPGCLSKKVALITGAGGGIGYQTARSLLWLGASVIIAEINRPAGKQAAEKLSSEFGKSRVEFYQTDIGRRTSVRRLVRKSRRYFKHIDILINNATIAPLGKVIDAPITIWDASYRVNLRGPVLLIQHILPEMLKRNDGVIINISSTGTAFMGAYETFKSAQVHLTETLDAELEGSDVTALTVGPGLAPTETATQAIEELAPKMGMSLDDFYAINQNAMLSVEEAGAGFAAAVVQAGKFRGQEISAMQALLSAGYQPKPADSGEEAVGVDEENRPRALALAESVSATFQAQTSAWQERSLFERQWMLRDFRKNAGMPVESMRDQLKQLISSLREGKPIHPAPLEGLTAYYDHMAKLAEGYTKDPDVLRENLNHIRSWQQDIARLIQMLGHAR